MDVTFPSSQFLGPLCLGKLIVVSPTVPLGSIVKPTHKYTKTVTNSGMSAMQTNAATKPVRGFQILTAESVLKIAKQR